MSDTTDYLQASQFSKTYYKALFGCRLFPRSSEFSKGYQLDDPKHAQSCVISKYNQTTFNINKDEELNDFDDLHKLHGQNKVLFEDELLKQNFSRFIVGGLTNINGDRAYLIFLKRSRVKTTIYLLRNSIILTMKTSLNTKAKRMRKTKMETKTRTRTKISIGSGV